MRFLMGNGGKTIVPAPVPLTILTDKEESATLYAVTPGGHIVLGTWPVEQRARFALSAITRWLNLPEEEVGTVYKV